MAEVRMAVEALRQALRSIPKSDVDPENWSIAEAYLEALDEYDRHLITRATPLNAGAAVEGATHAAEKAAGKAKWTEVVQHAFTAIGALPGKPSWTPRRPLPPPKR